MKRGHMLKQQPKNSRANFAWDTQEVDRTLNMNFMRNAPAQIKLCGLRF